MLSIKTGKEINNAVTDLKKQGLRIKSNVFDMIDALKTYDAVITAESVVYIEKDHGINRLKFYTSSSEDIVKILRDISIPITADIISKNSDEFSSEMDKSGFTLLARMRRLVNRDITETVNKLIPPKFIRGGVALSSDTKAINNLLWTTFDTRISHLFSDDELAAVIEKGEVFTVKEHNEVVSVLHRLTDNNRFYINQVINLSDKECIHSLMYAELRKFCDSGGRYLYAWVQDTNIASSKFHAKYGMAFDGLYDLVYVNQ